LLNEPSVDRTGAWKIVFSRGDSANVNSLLADEAASKLLQDMLENQSSNLFQLLAACPSDDTVYVPTLTYVSRWIQMKGVTHWSMCLLAILIPNQKPSDSS
jgi:hypothetical protein